MDFKPMCKNSPDDIKRAIAKLQNDPTKRLDADPKAVVPRDGGKARVEVRKRPRT
jgi:hypothetical protein